MSSAELHSVADEDNEAVTVESDARPESSGAIQAPARRLVRAVWAGLASR